MRLKSIKDIQLTFWQQWLLHSFLLWVILTFYDLLTYWAAIQENGYYIFYQDGSPFTVWDRFSSQVTEDFLWLWVLLGVYFIEAAYHLIYRQLARIYKALGVLLGIGCIVFYAIAAVEKLEQGMQMSYVLLGPLYALIFSAIYAFIYAVIRDYIYRKVHNAERRSEHSQAELAALKAQVNPHFFFNTLNSIYGTALEEKASRTAESIEQLSAMMRYTMHEAQQEFTSIAHEIEFIKDYLELQRLRLPQRENIVIQTDISYDGTPYPIAPMLLIPFVENAFKYGISVDQDCWIHLWLDVHNAQLHFRIQNKLLKGKHPSESMGTGISNTRKRLQLLYPGKYELQLTDQEAYTVDLKLQLG